MTRTEHRRIHHAADAHAPTQSDAELIAAVVAGNHDALEDLHLRYGALVWRIAAGILRDEAEAEDVTQEVFFEVYRRATLYDGARGTVRGWLMQYAYHRALRRKSALRLRAAYRGVPLDDLETQLSRQDLEIARAERTWLIRSGLPKLSAGQRATIELVCFEDLSLREAADRLGASIGCVRHCYYRAIAALRGFLAETRCTQPKQARPRAGDAPDDVPIDSDALRLIVESLCDTPDAIDIRAATQ